MSRRARTFPDSSAIIMNRRQILLGASASMLAGALRPAQIFAQQPAAPSAAVVAARVQAFYEQTRTVQASFAEHYWHRVQQRTQSSRGRITIERPGKIRFDYAQPAGKVLISDGAQWTMYEPEEGGAGQYLRGSAAAASTSALGFLMGTARLTEFRRSLRPRSSGQPDHTDALELRPIRPDPHYVRVVVYVDDRPESAGVVRRVSIEDADGNWNRFDFADLRFNRELDARTFSFTPPAGAREIRTGG